MPARGLTTLLPGMTLAEALGATHIHRVAGLTGARIALMTTGPCRAPHHTVADVGLIGGCQILMPGVVSLARDVATSPSPGALCHATFPWSWYTRGAISI
jgi:magnesium chelatase family protein